MVILITNGSFSYHMNIMLFQLVKESYVRDIEQVGCFSNTQRFFHGFLKYVLFMGRQQVLQRVVFHIVVPITPDISSAFTGFETEKDAILVDFIAVSDNSSSFDDIFKFPYISWPVMPIQLIYCLFRENLNSFNKPQIESKKKRLHQ